MLLSVQMELLLDITQIRQPLMEHPEQQAHQIMRLKQVMIKEYYHEE